MTFSLNTENGVSSCGGRAVRPIICRFCGYLTSGRSPLPIGKVTVSAHAAVARACSGPKAVASAPDPLIRARLLITPSSRFVIPILDNAGSRHQRQPEGDHGRADRDRLQRRQGFM